MNIYQEIKEKRDILRARYGGMMSFKDLGEELGVKRVGTETAIREMEIPATRVGRQLRYDTDVVARKLVERRGMV